MSKTTSRAPGRIALLTAVIVFLIGLYLAVGGAWLVVIGGSAYYVVAGAILIATAVLLAAGRRSALWLYAALLLGTMIWAIAEVGLDFWSLAPRGDILVPLGVWLLLPLVWSRLAPRKNAPVAALGIVVLASIAVVGVALSSDRRAVVGEVTSAFDVAAAASRAPAAADWLAYGGTNDGDRFSGLSQITPGNAGQLKLAWQFRTGDLRGPNDPEETTNEDTPLKVGDTVYVCSPHDMVFALDASTGHLRWKFDPKIERNTTFQHMTCRGVSYHATAPGALTADGQPAPIECPHRIFLPTNDGHLFALDADSGALCTGFGENGRIDLRAGSEDKIAGRYMGTSPPVATDKILIMGGAVIDNYSLHVPSGVIRGFDIYSGKLVWVFDAGNHEPNEMPSPTHHFSAGSPNSWSVSVADEKLGLVYVPLGSGANDIWGGTRTPDEERYDSALVALDIATGHLRWSFQNVHHDLWDMDMPSQPSLVDLRKDSGIIPAIYVPAKTGNIFVLNRRDGHLIVPAPERPVPQGAAPGDYLSPTQPFSDLSFRPRRKLTDADMWGGTMFDQLACRIIFHSMRYEGPFTPPTVGGDIVFPGDLGMFEWGGIAIDPVHQIAIANPISIPFVQNLLPRGPNNPEAPNAAHPSGTETGVQPMYGARFGVTLNALLSPLGIPCMAPPWGTMAAIDLRTNKIVWRHRVGTTRDEAPFGIPFALGVPMLGGPLLTAGGVTFISATMDDYIRAFDARNGHLLWEDRLPAGGQSTPMSYQANGHQFVLSVDGGHGSFGTKLGDYVRAYALPGG